MCLYSLFRLKGVKYKRASNFSDTKINPDDPANKEYCVIEGEEPYMINATRRKRQVDANPTRVPKGIIIQISL